MTRSRLMQHGVLLLIGLGSGARAHAALARVILCDIPGQPTSLVPAATAGATRYISFDRPYRSPDGSRWIISALTNTGNSNTDEVVIVGGGPTNAGAALLAQEGVTAVDSGRTIDSGSIDSKYGVNDGGVAVFTANLSGATTDDECIVTGASSSTLTVAIREGAAIPALPGLSYGTTNTDPSIDNAGNVAVRTVGIIGGPASDAACLRNGGTVLVARRNVTVPAGQAGGATDAWQNLDATGFFVAENGPTLIQGDTVGASTSDDMVAVNGTVVIQEGQIIPGSGFASPVETDLEALMMTNGDWFVRGDNVDQLDWVVHNGVVVARTGAPITPGSTELFDDALFAATFFVMQSNSVGDYVIGGVTTDPDPQHNSVIVKNGVTVVVRRGDPVDLDGNGLADDNAFIDTFNNDDSFLTDDGTYYFDADLRDSLGTIIGHGFLVLAPPVCVGDLTGDGVTNESDLGALLANWLAGAGGDLSGDGQTDESDLGILLGDWQCGA
ncbi:MAG: hypothetical protein U1D55_09080 [Phycisphaerae bacterium]